MNMKTLVLPQARTAGARLVTDKIQQICEAFPEYDDKTRARFAQIALSIANRSDLAGCTPTSVVMAIYGCAKLGLVPDDQLGNVYILPQRKKGELQAQIRVGYRGYAELARRSNLIAALHAEIVYGNDHYEEVLGTERKVIHRRWDVEGHTQPGEAKFVYVTWYEKGSDTTEFHRIGRERIERARKASKTAGKTFSPWDSDELAMWKKTAVLDASKLWPLSPELADAVAWDEEADRGATQSIDVPGMTINKNEDIPPNADDDPLLMRDEADEADDPSDDPDV